MKWEQNLVATLRSTMIKSKQDNKLIQLHAVNKPNLIIAILLIIAKHISKMDSIFRYNKTN